MLYTKLVCCVVDDSIVDQLTKALEDRYTGSEPSPGVTYHEGQAVIAKYSDDNTYNRAIIKTITDKGYEVYIVIIMCKL